MPQHHNDSKHEHFNNVEKGETRSSYSTQDTIHRRDNSLEPNNE